MGKCRNKNNEKPHKVNPTGLLSLRDMVVDDNDSVNEPIQNVICQLTSHSNEEKMYGLQALSHLCEQRVFGPQIVSSECVRIAAPLLVDSDPSLRHATTGALRNLSAISVEICENLVEQDILTPLLALLRNNYFNTNWVPAIEKKTNQLDSNSDTFLHAVNLLWNLCESTSVALECFNQSQILHLLIRFLDYTIFGMEIAISTAQLLLIASEDNSAAWKVLAEFNTEFLNLTAINGDFQSVILSTICAGIMSNVPVLLMQNLRQIISSLGKTLEINHRSVLSALTSKLPLESEPPPIEILDEEMNEETEADASLRRLQEDQPSEIETEVKLIGYLLSAQRMAAETLSNICNPDDEELSEDIDDKSDAESVHDYDVAVHLTQHNADKIPVEISEAIKAHQIVEKLWARAQLLPENVRQILASNGKVLNQRQISLRVSSLLCLHNLCNCLDIEDLGGPNALYNVWIEVGSQIFQAQEEDTAVEASTSLMRATLEHLKKSPDLFKQMTEPDLSLILNGVNVCKNQEIRANWLRMLGTLGCLLSEPLVKKIAEIILTTAAKEDDVWTISEALDSFMDIFSENDWNQIVIDLNVIGQSRELEKMLKTKMRQQKRELGDRYPAVVTVRTNLTRFCKYLETQQKKTRN